MEDDGLRRRELFGLDFVDAPTLDPIVEWLLMRERRPNGAGDQLPVVVTPNVDQLVRIERNSCPIANELIQRAGVVLPDGQPIVWASRLLRSPLAARLPGSSLVAALWPAIVAKGQPTLVVAPSETVAALLKADHPGAVVVVAPMLAQGDRIGLEKLAGDCLAALPPPSVGHVFVALGFPNRELLIHELLTQWPDPSTPMFLAIGGSFEMYYGLKPRAPWWVQKCGLEWFYRFLLDPRRLFRRYFIDDIGFISTVWREWRRRRRFRIAPPR